MSYKAVPKKAAKVDRPQMDEGQAAYAGWDEGAYDRAGFGLGQFMSPVSEAPIPKAKKVRE